MKIIDIRPGEKFRSLTSGKVYIKINPFKGKYVTCDALDAYNCLQSSRKRYFKFDREKDVELLNDNR